MYHSSGAEVGIKLIDSGKILQEYERKLHRNGKLMEASIEARTGEPFGIQVVLRRAFSFFDAGGISAKVKFDDGEVYEDETLIAKDTLVLGEDGHRRYFLQKFYVADASDHTIQVAFAELNIQETLHPTLTDTRVCSGKVGTIQVDLFRVGMEPLKVGAHLKRRQSPSSTVPTVSAETLEKFKVSHIVTTHSTNRLKKRYQRSFKMDRIDQPNGHIATFRLHYGSLAVLQAQGVKIPPNIAPYVAQHNGVQASPSNTSNVPRIGEAAGGIDASEDQGLSDTTTDESSEGHSQAEAKPELEPKIEPSLESKVEASKPEVTAAPPVPAFRYGLACQVCIQEKKTCYGERPVCSDCKKSGKLCGYARQDSTAKATSGTAEMEDKIKTAALFQLKRAAIATRYSSADSDSKKATSGNKKLDEVEDSSNAENSITDKAQNVLLEPSTASSPPSKPRRPLTFPTHGGLIVDSSGRRWSLPVKHTRPLSACYRREVRHSSNTRITEVPNEHEDRELQLLRERNQNLKSQLEREAMKKQLRNENAKLKRDLDEMRRANLEDADGGDSEHELDTAALEEIEQEHTHKHRRVSSNMSN